MKRKFALVLVALLAGVLVLRGTAEDSWNCIDGQWVRHGNPSAPKPTSGCGPAAPLADGVHLGFIRSVNMADGFEIAFDDARRLSGKEGEDAALAAGHCTEETRSDCLPNDYFILNTSSATMKLVGGTGLRIFMQTWEAGEQGVMINEADASEFAELVNDSAQHWSKLPYNVTLRNDRVTQIEEIYIP